MTEKVVSLQFTGGIQRDGTLLASTACVDGQWVRFQQINQKGKILPKKMGGYIGAFLNSAGISRGVIMTSTGGLNYIVSGYSGGLQQWTTSNSQGIGFGPTSISVSGPVSAVSITSGGSSYTAGTYTSVPLGPASGGLSTITITSAGTLYTNGTYTGVAVNPSSGGILLPTITNGGSLYTNGIYTGVSITAVSGSGATATVTVSGNKVTSINMTSAGSGYTVGEAINISAAAIGGTGSGFSGTVGSLNNGSGALATVTVSGGSVTIVNITTNGSGYSVGQTLSIPTASIGGTGSGFVGTSATLNDGSGALATVTVVSGSITSVVITSGGSGYSIGETVTVLASNVGGTGSGFSASVTSLTTYAPDSNTLWQFDIGYDPNGTGNYNLIAHPGENLNNISSLVNTRPLIGQFTGTSLSPVGVFTATGTLVSGSTLVTFSTVNTAIGAGVSVSGTGIPSNTTVSSATLRNYGPIGTVGINTAGSGYTNGTYTSVPLVGNLYGSGATATVVVSGGVITTITLTLGGSNYISLDTFTIAAASVGGTGSGFQGSILSLSSITSTLYTALLSAAATSSGSQTLTFDNNISVSGGAVMIFPYLFVYGNYGLIQNSSAGNFNNWIAADANSNNVASTKIVKGLPLRGGSTSPSGLFWSLDSVIRVSYSPTTVGTQTIYWTYDLISSQSSIMSSQCVIEYDGIFYWAGTDRFLMYNGVVQEIPNSQNQNWFFDNLNIQQRQKVWASKVPRWGEIWWFYPRGNATECTDAIIYNVRYNIWYDAGQALGAQRSAGIFSEVFPYPIWAGNVANSTGQYTIWQHETGKNQVYTNQVDAINSYFTTNVIGTSAGLVGSQQDAGQNVWTRIERVEPDFNQVGNMTLTVIGKGYADDTDQASSPYTFSASTLKIDMKEQRRELRLKFNSNVQDGDYYMGNIVLSVDIGDVRGTGNP
jgi:hypothetical protein